MLRANALGDFIFVLPALEALRAAYPQAEIVLLGAPWHAQLWRDRPGVDRVLVVPPAPGIRTATEGEPESSIVDFLAAARAERFDLALQLHGGGATPTRWWPRSAPGSPPAYGPRTRRRWTAGCGTSTTSTR